MTCTSFSAISSLSDLAVWPTGCHYYFYLELGLAILIVIAWIMTKSQETREGKGELISSLAISSFAMLILASTGTLVKNSLGVPMIQKDILLYFVAIAIIMFVLWIPKD